MDELLKNKTLAAVHVYAATASAAIGTALTYPLNSLKVLEQVGSSAKKSLTFADVLHRVQAISGYSGLYNGVGWLTLGRTLGLGARFGVFEISTAFYKDGCEDDNTNVFEALVAGFAAGMVECLVSSPFEMIKLRAQMASASRVVHSPTISEKRVVSPLLSRLLPRYYSLRNSVGFLSTLSTRHANMLDALKGYPWMMTGYVRPPAVSSVRIS